MARACLGLLAGMYALQLSSFAGDSDRLNGVFVAAIVLLVARQFTLLFWFVAGVVLFLQSAERLLAARIPAAIEGDSIVVQMRVQSFPEASGEAISFIASPANDARLPQRIRLSWFQPPVTVRYGDRWTLEVRLRRPRGNRNPGGFDYEAWLFRERIAAVGYVVNSHRNHLLRAGKQPWLQRLRKHAVERIDAVVGDAESAAVLMAVVVGARHRISREQWDRYAASGSTHLMAISGLHIGLCAVGAYYCALLLGGLAGRGAPGRNHHLAAVACSLAIAAGYAQLTGFAVPARRASLMLLLAGCYLLSRQQTNGARVVATVALLLAASDPLVTMAPGFILSFAAVAILIWAFRCGQRRLPTLQLSLLMGLLPFTAMLFDRFSLAALPVNLVAVPLFSFVTVPLALAGMLLDGPASAVGDGLLAAAAISVRLLDSWFRWFADFGWASRVVPTLTGVALLYLWLPALWVLLPTGWPGRQAAWLGLAGLCLYMPRGPGPGCFAATVLDVGQGLAVVVQTRAQTLLYDTGPAYRNGSTAASTVVLPFLRSRGIQHIDRLMVSHADLDHAGGVAAVTAAMPVTTILAGEPLPGLRHSQCTADQHWTWDGVEFSVIYPGSGSAADGNDRSCVLLVSAGRFRLLLTGDIERAAEHAILRTGRLPPVQVATMPHHGSRTSSTAPFVQALRADYVLASAAYANRWGFPLEDVVRRWQEAGTTVLNTADSGAVQVNACAQSGLESIRAYRVLKRRIWHE